MFSIFLLSIIATLLFLPFGLVLDRKNLSSIIHYEHLSRIFIYSLILISFLALFLNFFIPLTKDVNSIFLVFSLIISYYYRNYFLNLKYLIFIIIVSLIVFLLITKSNTFRPDAGLYHLPYISILNSEKIIFGLSNFHYRYGHISIIQYTSAFFNNHIFLSNGIIFPIALIYASIVINFFSQIRNYLAKKNYNFHLFFLVSTLIYILGKMHRYSEFGNDTPSHILFLFLLSEILRNNFNHKLSNIRNFFLLAAFIIMNKIFFILSILLPLIFLTKKNYKRIIFNGKSLFIFIFFLMWIIKSTIVSGCVIYPIKLTCFNNLTWTDINQVKIVSNENQAWAKSWPGYDSTSGEINHSDYNKNFNWLKTWLKFNGYKSFKIIFTYLFILFLFGLLIYKKNYNSDFFIRTHNLYIKYIILVLIIGILIWFLKAPDYRYGTGYIIGFLSIIFCKIISNNLKSKIYISIFAVLIISLSIFSIKNLKRIIIVEGNYFNYPWPKYYSHSKDNIYEEPKKIKINEKDLYISKGLCMFGKAPCSRNIGNFSVVKKFNYDFFVIK